MQLAGIHANSIYKPRELQVHVGCLSNGNGGCNDAAEFKLRNLQKEILELSLYSSK